MPVENATTVSELVATNPLGSDPIGKGDDHIRLIKQVLQNDVLTNRLNLATIAIWQADTSAKAGDVVTIAGRCFGTGEVISGILTVNGRNIVQHGTLSLSWELRIGEVAILEQFGFGSGGDETADFVATILDLNDNNKVPISYNSTIELSNVSLTGITDLHMIAGPLGILDFKHAVGGIGLEFKEGGIGVRSGCRTITWDNIQLTDSNAISLLDEMFAVRGGATGGTPFQTTSDITINGGRIIQYQNINGIARHLTNISHVEFNNWFDDFNLSLFANSLVIDNDININTGVQDFNNCGFRSSVTPIVINAAVQLLDTFNFNGGFIGNRSVSTARELISLNGTSPIAALNFRGVHMECRDDTETTIISVTGKWLGGVVGGCHFSGGTEAKQTQTLVDVTGTGEFRAVDFAGNEALRIKDRSLGGRLFHFENTAVTQIDEPIKIGTWFLNVTNPDIVIVDAGGNEDKIFKSLISHPKVTDRVATGRDRVYNLEDSETPSVEGAVTFEITAVPTSNQITDFIDEYKGQLITLVSSISSVVIIRHNASKIRCDGANDLTMTINDSVQFLRTQADHWVQVNALVDTDANKGLTANTAELASLTSDINIQNKFAGKQVLNTQTGVTVTAIGSTAAAVWNNADGTLAHTPV